MFHLSESEKAGNIPDITGFTNVNCFKRGGNGIGLLTDVEAEYLFIASDAISSRHCGEASP